jgi:hypothetical protein
VVPYGGRSSASMMAEARAEFRCRDQRVDVRYWRESLLLCTERDTQSGHDRGLCSEIDVRSWYGHILVIAYGFGSRS